MNVGRFGRGRRSRGFHRSRSVIYRRGGKRIVRVMFYKIRNRSSRPTRSGVRIRRRRQLTRTRRLPQRKSESVSNMSISAAEGPANVTSHSSLSSADSSSMTNARTFILRLSGLVQALRKCPTSPQLKQRFVDLRPSRSIGAPAPAKTVPEEVFFAAGGAEGAWCAGEGREA
jgi:hypothetical protein